MSEECNLLELRITEDEYREYLIGRLRLQGSNLQEVEKVSFPFLLASGSELLRSFILNETEFVSSLPDQYRLPDRGFIWYLFSQAVREIQATSEGIVIKYKIQDQYRKPFKQFHL
ncbi:MAG: hypothetical protein JW986_11055 [Methanotrichaceae archaeon]|nr:hypothetical protein [Methanotrichaceae archaeon]